MEYIYLLLACACYAFQFVFQKLFKLKTVEGLSVCLWYQFVSCTVAAIFLIAKAGLPTAFTWTAFALSLLHAASCILCSLSTITAIGSGNVSVLSTYALAGGFILPYLFGVIALDEKAGIFKWIGILLFCCSLLPAFLKNIREKRPENGRNPLKFILCCVLVFVTNGTAVIFTKIHQISEASIGEDSFIFISVLSRCIFAASVILIMAAIHKSKGDKDAFRNALWEIGIKKMTGLMFAALLFFSGVYAVCNTLGDIFSLRCMITMDATLQFPILSAVVIIMTTLFGRFFFKEKINKETAISLAFTVVGIGLYII